MIDEAALLQDMVLEIRLAEGKLQVQGGLPLTAEYVLVVLAVRTARISCNLLAFLPSSDLDPALPLERSPHRWVANEHCEVLLALDRDSFLTISLGDEAI